ncbi:MAG TPA: DUF4189 domain-containing protein [Mycobacterium sp.]
MIKKVALGSVGLLVGAVLVATPAHAANGNAGGIAFSPDDGVHGWVNHVSDRDAAIDGSVAACESNGGKSCVWAAWNANGCLALLVDQDGEWGGGIGPTAKQAVKDAVNDAAQNNITIDTQTPVVSFCTWDQGPDQG